MRGGGFCLRLFIKNIMAKQKIFDTALKTVLFLSPIFTFANYQLSFARGLFFIIGAFVLFGISLGLEPRRKFSNIWLSLFLILALIRIFFDNSFGNDKQIWFNFWLSCAGFIYVFAGVLIFYVVYTYAGDIKQYLFPIMWVCVLNVILAIAQISGYDFMWQHAPSIGGFMENSSQLGQYSAMSLPILFYLNPILALIPLITLIIPKSISPILATAVGMAILGGFKEIDWKIKAILGVLLVLAGLLNFGYIKAKFQCRPIMWQKTLKTALQKPYLGWGYGSFREKVTGNKACDSLGGVEFSRPHNDYLHTGQELGFPILIAIGMFFINLFRKFIAIKNKDRLLLCLAVSVLIVLVNMSGQTLIRYASIAGTFVVLLALFCIKMDEEISYDKATDTK